MIIYDVSCLDSFRADTGESRQDGVGGGALRGVESTPFDGRTIVSVGPANSSASLGLLAT